MVYKSLTNVEALQHLYDALGGDPKKVKSIDLIHVMIDRIADYVKEHGGGGGGCNCSLATEEEVEEVAENIMGQSIEQYAMEYLDNHSDEFVASKEEVKKVAEELMNNS